MTPQIEGERRKGQRRKRKCVMATEENGGMSLNGRQAGRLMLRNLTSSAWLREKGMKSEPRSKPSGWERKTSFLPFSAGESIYLHDTGTYRYGSKASWILNKLPPPILNARIFQESHKNYPPEGEIPELAKI
jgi:hypothetical protein